MADQKGILRPFGSSSTSPYLYHRVSSAHGLQAESDGNKACIAKYTDSV